MALVILFLLVVDVIQDAKTIPAVLAHVQAHVNVIVGDLKIAIAASADVNGKVGVRVVTPFIIRLKDICAQAVIQIQAIINSRADLNVILAANGTVLSIKDCALVLANVIAAICAVLNIIVNAVVAAEFKECIVITAQVGVVLTEILTLLFQIHAEIKPAFCSFLSAEVIAVIRQCNFTTVKALVEAYVKI